jgi:hypothetical protein
MTEKYRAERKFIWSNGIDMLQDAAIQTAIDQWYRDTGALIDKFKMLKIIIMKYGANSAQINKILMQQGEMFVKPMQTEPKPNKWVCGKCEQDAGKFSGEIIPNHSYHCKKRKTEKGGFENFNFDL